MKRFIGHNFALHRTRYVLLVKLFSKVMLCSFLLFILFTLQKVSDCRDPVPGRMGRRLALRRPLSPKFPILRRLILWDERSPYPKLKTVRKNSALSWNLSFHGTLTSPTLQTAVSE